MDKSSETSDAETYKQRGYLAPLPLLSSEELHRYRNHFDAYAERFGGLIPRPYQHKANLLAPWMDELVHHPRILASVREILGPDILCWTTNLFVKQAMHPGFVSWHQDSSYWALQPHEVLTAWIALSPSTCESGCLQVVPGSHLWPQGEHVDTFGKDNLLSRGQTFQGQVDPQQVVDVDLQPGEMSLHHIKLLHGSRPNASGQPRIGIAIRYMSARVRKLGVRESAILVSGQAKDSHFVLEKRPTTDFSIGNQLVHNRALRRQVLNNFRPIGPTPLAERLRLFLQRVLAPLVLDLRYLRLWLNKKLVR